MTCPHCPHCQGQRTIKHRKALQLLNRLTGAARTTEDGKALRRAYRSLKPTTVYEWLNSQHGFRWNPYKEKWVNQHQHAQLWKKSVNG